MNKNRIVETAIDDRGESYANVDSTGCFMLSDKL